MTNLLPPHDGLLPKWLLLVVAIPIPSRSPFSIATNILQVGLISIGNSIQAYTTLSYTRRLYAGPANNKAPEALTSPVTPLSARTFGTWTFIASIVRLYAAYHLDEPAWYQVAFWTYLVAFGHFMSELVVYKTARWRGPWLAPAIVSTSSLLWMTMQYSYYVK
jgi:Erg28 like protein